MTYIVATEQALVCRHLTRVSVRKDGYDKFGSYWGIGLPVWTFDLYFQPSDNRFYTDTAVRARTKTEAKRKIKERYPAIKKFVTD